MVTIITVGCDSGIRFATPVDVTALERMPLGERVTARTTFDLIADAAVAAAAGVTTLVAWGEGDIWRKACETRRRTPSIRRLVRVGGSSAGEGEVDYADAVAACTPASAQRGADVAAYFPTGGTTGAP